MDFPRFFQGPATYYHSQFPQESFVDDLLIYPNDEIDGPLVSSAAADHHHHHHGTTFHENTAVSGGFVTGTSTDSTLLDNSTSCNSTGSTGLIYPFGGGDTTGCRNFVDAQFPSEICIPHDDFPELEWLSRFADDSFPCEDLQNLNLISGIESGNSNEFQTEPNRAISTTIFRPEMAVPAKARSKRSRAPPCNWTSRLLAVTSSPRSSSTTTTATTNDHPSSTMVTSSESIGSSLEKKAIKATLKKKDSVRNSEGRRCLHCATDQTPQWRTGPMGPKTLCNACGVRFKSGRLLPEYRPAASPTFIQTKHSNSHRKVIELRRQNEVSNVQQQHYQQQFLHQNMLFNVANVDDFLIHQPIGPDFRQLI